MTDPMIEDMNVAWSMVTEMQRRNFRLTIAQDMMGIFIVRFSHILNPSIYAQASDKSTYRAIYDASEKALDASRRDPGGPKG